jgi:hypothetical protein
LEARQQAQEHTWNQVAAGESPEFNQMIERIVDRRIRQHEQETQADLQGLVDQMAGQSLAIQVEPNINNRQAIFRRAMEDLRRALPTQEPERLILINRLLDLVTEAALAAIPNQE